MSFDLLLTNIGQLATPTGKSSRKGKRQSDLSLIDNAVIGITGGKIAFVGQKKPEPTAKKVVDCGQKLVTPGLIDCHTHLVFGGWRQNELSLRLAGLSYLDILKSGGGILSTVEKTRAASKDELLTKSKKLLREMLEHGVTTCEAKSGYGLDLETEIKQLEVIKALNECQPVDVAATFLGAHAVPAEYKSDRKAYISLLCDTVLPEIAKRGLAEYCDIFCEKDVFTAAESKYILQKAAALGLKLKAHVDEIEPVGGSRMAAEVGCVSAEHLIVATDEGIEALSSKNVIATLLPATSFYLDKPYARARNMIHAGLAVAVASDFNPGSNPGNNLHFAMTLACLKYNLTPAEALCAVTLNAAAALDRADKTGSIEIGKAADLVIWDAPDLAYIFYRYGSNLVNTVYKNGTIVHKTGEEA